MTISTLAGSVYAAQWPERPVKIVVPFKAGGSTDLTARQFTAAIEENKLLPQALSVVNVGGHSSVGARRVKDAKANGYEFLVHETGLIGAQAAGIIDFGYKDYKPVAATGQVCMALLARKDSGFDSLGDAVAWATKRPSEMVFGVNFGGLNHMAGILIENATGVKFRYAQIGGSADNFAALTGKQIQLAAVGAAGAKNFTLDKNGNLSDASQVKTLALLDKNSHPQLPGVKTAKEQGVDVNFCFSSYWLAPKDTPDHIVDQFANALEAASKTSRVQNFYKNTLTSPVFIKGESFAKHLDETAEVIGPIAKQAALSKN